jgi:hypothetical protein
MGTPFQSRILKKWLFECSDDTSAGLHLRRAVTEFIAEPGKFQRKPDVVLPMPAETCRTVKLFIQQIV